MHKGDARKIMIDVLRWSFALLLWAVLLYELIKESRKP